ncbi:hypothetical protein [Rhizosphaericola mali]|uniref:Uncharacterized protein n=1 Tax=Rhizosphaericola mali TaxID=2545455 RepID=A0A5P2G987_9BACT|nr:hypothetical protein [Rhizosphaericola mali]QES90512.1 hypothetical protein E0W69_018230 [Rhizosphaericola mali]
MKQFMIVIFLIGLFLFLNGSIQFANASMINRQSSAYHIGQIVRSAVQPFVGIIFAIIAIKKLKLADH